MSDSFQNEIIRVISDRFSGVAVELEGPISVRDYSEIFRAHIGTSPPLIWAVKRCLVSRTSTPDEAAARDQFLALERVSKAFATRDPRYRVPSPLFLDTSLASFGMSWIEGQSLTQKMQWLTAYTEGPKWLEGAGAWLGSFHKAGPLRNGHFNSAERIDSIADLLNAPLPDQSFVRSSRILSQNVMRVADCQVQVSWLHGDCKTDNFLIGKGAIFSIDLSLAHENAIEHDLAQFLNHFELLLSNPKCLHLACMKSSLLDAFWRGYQSTGPSISHACLRWIRLWAALSLWRSMLSVHEGGIRPWLLNRIFSRLATRLGRDLDLAAKSK